METAHQIYTPTYQFQPSQGSIFSARWSPDQGWIGLAYSDSHCRVITPTTGQNQNTFECTRTESSVPFTALAWRPKKSTALVKNVFIGVTATGEVMHWHAGRESKIIHSMTLPSTLWSVDYSLDGTQYAVGCGDNNLLIFDETTKQQQLALNPGLGDSFSTRCRVVSVKFISPHMIASGGWDKNIFLWDLRTQKIARTFVGCHMRGDAIDTKDDILLAGNYNHEKQIITYSISQETELSSMSVDEFPPVLVYSAQFSAHDNGKYFAFGGTGTNKLFVHSTDTWELQGETEELAAPIFSIDFSEKSNEVIVGLGNGEVHIYNI